MAIFGCRVVDDLDDLVIRVAVAAVNRWRGQLRFPRPAPRYPPAGNRPAPDRARFDAMTGQEGAPCSDDRKATSWRDGRPYDARLRSRTGKGTRLPSPITGRLGVPTRGLRPIRDRIEAIRWCNGKGRSAISIAMVAWGLSERIVIGAICACPCVWATPAIPSRCQARPASSLPCPDTAGTGASMTRLHLDPRSMVTTA